MRNENILLTGATGAFGKYLLKELVSTGYHVTALVRAASDNEARKRLVPYLDEQTSAQVKVLKADLTKINLGLDSHTYSELYKSITGVLHAAASTRFDLTLTEARKNNVTTLKNVLEFVNGAQNLTKFGFVSTAFVAGKKTGLIPETVMDSTAGFVNTYDQTKFEAENLVRAKMQNLPITIYRPSLIVAPDSDKHHAAVIVLNLIKNDLLPILPGQPDDLIDLISSDTASKAIVSLFSDNFVSEQTCHIVSGEHAPTLISITGLAQQTNAKAIYTGHNPDAYDDAVTKLTAEQPALAPIYSKIDCFIKYLCYPKVFARDNAEKVLQKPSENEAIMNILKQLVSND